MEECGYDCDCDCDCDCDVVMNTKNVDNQWMRVRSDIIE
jgi:hypothetical protein